MYPISLGYDQATSRIQALLANGHHAEALLTAVFTFEKTVRRMLRYYAVCRGFTSKHAEVLFAKMGFHQLKDVWQCFEKSNRSLPDSVGLHWQCIPHAVTMRNKIVHGEQVYNLAECKAEAQNVLNALDAFRKTSLNDVGYDGWTKLPVRRKPRLEWHAA
jgi:hypothetical protein